MVHRPHHPAGWAVPLVVSVPFAVFAALGPPGPLVGLAVLVGLGLPVAYALSEWFLLQHRIHEHGVVLRTDLPGTYTYVVPLSTIDPDQVRVAARSRIPPDAAMAARVSRRFRHNPLLPSTVTFRGLDPEPARRLAKRRVPWRAAAREAAEGNVQVWEISTRDPEALRRALVAAIHASEGGPGA